MSFLISKYCFQHLSSLCTHIEDNDSIDCTIETMYNRMKMEVNFQFDPCYVTS